jgi:transposase
MFSHAAAGLYREFAGAVDRHGSLQWIALSGAGSARARAPGAIDAGAIRKALRADNKSDFLDAEAIAEAVQRPRMRFVPIKTEEQLDLQALHRVRERWVMRRTAVVNQIRSLLLERGLTLPKGRSHLDEQLPRILEDAELRLSNSFRVLLAQLKLELEQLTSRLEQMDRVIQQTAKESDACQRLAEIPGVGPVTATALIAAVGDGSAFQKGRNLAAWVGIVPRECSTGGKQKLLGISKRGNRYLRRLFVQGARSVLQQRHNRLPACASG